MTDQVPGFASRIPAPLGILPPIIQAGMSRASSSAPLAAAVSGAGGLGVIAAIRAVRRRLCGAP